MNIDGDLLYEFTFGFFQKIIGFASALIDFLFFEIDFSFIEEGLVVSMWQVVGGVGLVFLLVAFLIKKITPLF